MASSTTLSDTLPPVRRRDFAQGHPRQPHRNTFSGDIEGNDHNEQAPNIVKKGDLDLICKFGETMELLDTELGSFSTEARQVGRSFSVLVAAEKLREQLARMQFACYENAAHIFPSLEDTHRKGHLRGGIGKFGGFRTKRARSQNLSLDQIPEQVEKFATTLGEFRDRLNEFREYDDGSIEMKASLASFEADLKYWASCLHVYVDSGRCYSAPVQNFVYQLTMEMESRIKNITSNLKLFIKIGMPAIRYGQKRDAKGLMGISTGATFFSAVTATMLQISYTVTPNPTISIVNTFWFCSLVLSIGAALNSLLAMVWKQSFHGSRGHSLPFWVTVWIHASPPGFLVISIGCFSAGLVLFAYASGQNRFTSSFTLVATIITSLGIAVIALWMAHEQLIALAHPPPKRSSSEKDTWKDPVTLSGPQSNFRSPASSLAIRSPTVTMSHSWNIDNASDHSDDSEDSDIGFVPTMVARVRTFLNTTEPHHSADDVEQGVENSVETQQPLGEQPSYQNALRRAMTKHKFIFHMSRQRGDINRPHSPPVTVTHESSLTEKQAQRSTEAMLMPPISSETQLQIPTEAAEMSWMPKMPFLAVSRNYVKNRHGVIQHIKFSPDGKYLASTSYREIHGSTTNIYSVDGEQGKLSHVRKHSSRKYSGQLVWSFDSSILLIRLKRAVDVFNVAQGSTVRRIKRGRYVQSIRWLEGKAFVCIEKDTVFKLDLQGNETLIHTFPGLTLRDIAVMSPSRLCIVSYVAETSQGLQPRHPNVAEKRIMVYDLDTNQTSFSVPVLDDVRHVTPTNNGSGILLSFRSKMPPQFWALEAPTGSDSDVEFQMKSTYAPTRPEEFEGPSYPGLGDADSDQLIMCAGKTDVHLWNRDSGVLIHRFRPHDVQADHGSPCTTWCPASIPGSPTLFATGSKDEIKVWKFNPAQVGPQRPPLATLSEAEAEGLDGEDYREDLLHVP